MVLLGLKRVNIMSDFFFIKFLILYQSFEISGIPHLVVLWHDASILLEIYLKPNFNSFIMLENPLYTP